MLSETMINFEGVEDGRYRDQTLKSTALKLKSVRLAKRQEESRPEASEVAREERRSLLGASRPAVLQEAVRKSGGRWTPTA